MPLKNIQFAIRKANVVLLPMLPLDELKIITTIDILHCLSNYLGLADVIKDNVISIKRVFITLKNITRSLYQR